MTLLFIDGFDNISSADEDGDLTRIKWDSASLYVGRSTGRSGSGYSVSLGLNPLNDIFIAKDIPDQSGNTMVLGFAYRKYNGATVSANDLVNFYRVTGSTEEQLTIGLTSGGILEIKRGATVLATGTTVLGLDTWYYIEVKVLIHASAGTYHIKLNGADEIAAASSQNTQNSGTDDSVQSFSFNYTVSAAHYLLDDVYFMNTTGTINTDFLGDVTVAMLIPDSDNTAAWTRSAGSVNADLVDDPETPDGDTTYVHSATTTTQDWYVMPNGGTNVDTVFGVQVSTVARKDDAVLREVRANVKAPTTVQNGATTAMTTTYTGFTDMFETKDGSLAWDTTALDALLVGPEVVT